MLAEELQAPHAVGVLQLLKEATSEQAREDPDREEEPWLARHPSIGIRGEAAAGYDAVHVRVMGQGGSPGVQHQGGADPGTQVLSIGG
jgi:hypothetical protein